MKEISLIRSWAANRNLIEGSNRKQQFIKLAEEMGELAAGLARDDEALISDSIGDMVVVLTIMAAQGNTSFEACIAAAYDEIKGRTGRMVDGIFVKDA